MGIVQHAPLILASGSTIRQQMLKAVGLHFSVVPSGLDETALKAQHAEATPPELARILARAKALSVSRHDPEAFTIGADQLCVHRGQYVSKPGSHDRAEAQLALLSGELHAQHAAVVLTRGDTVLWEYADVAQLTLRTLSPADIHAYVAADSPLSSCGSYLFEKLGRHLFAKVQGDHDVIQGLPLVPLLGELHRLGVIGLSD